MKNPKTIKLTDKEKKIFQKKAYVDFMNWGKVYYRKYKWLSKKIVTYPFSDAVMDTILISIEKYRETPKENKLDIDKRYYYYKSYASNLLKLRFSDTLKKAAERKEIIVIPKKKVVKYNSAMDHINYLKKMSNNTTSKDIIKDAMFYLTKKEKAYIKTLLVKNKNKIDINHPTLIKLKKIIERAENNSV